MTKLILDTPEQNMGDALNVYFQNLRAISRLETGKTLTASSGSLSFVVTRNATSIRVEMKK